MCLLGRLTQLNKLSSILLCIGLLSACKSEPSKKIVINEKTCPQQQENFAEDDYRLFQMGDEWNRDNLADPKSFPFQVVQLFRTGMGAVGVGVYLGQFAHQHIVMTAAHVYPELESCAREVNFLIQHEGTRIYIECSGWHFRFTDNDIMLFSIKTRNLDDLSRLVPVDFSTQHTLGEPLNLVTITRGENFQFTWNIDKGNDCKLLSSAERLILDPDENDSHESHITSWSLPVACDGMRGDSGSPVYNLQNQLKGLLWTGSYPKTSQCSKVIDHDFLEQTENLWTSYNYFVPVSTLMKEIDSLLDKSKTLDTTTIDILTALSTKAKSTP